MGTTNFSAQEPSLGYYHQIRFSLYLLLQNKDKDNPCIKLENLDDIVIEDINRVDLYQTKLHINSIADLTDRSADFWKTIRVWSEAIISNLINVESTIFTLITTANVGETSFVKNLKMNFEKPDLAEVLNKMLQISAETTNETNKKGYEAFKNLTEEQQKKLIGNITIIDSSLSIEDTLAALKNELKFSAPVGKIDMFLELYLHNAFYKNHSLFFLILYPTIPRIHLLLLKKYYSNSPEVISRICHILQY